MRLWFKAADHFMRAGVAIHGSSEARRGRLIIGDLFRALLSLLILETVKSVMASVNFQLVLNELYSISYMRDSW
jgi:hypothetical protein